MPFKGTQLHYILPLPPTTHQHLRQRGATATHTQDNNQIHFMTPIIQVDSQSQPLQLLLVKAQPNPGSQEASFLPPTHLHTPKSHLSALVVVNINSIPSPGRERWFVRSLVGCCNNASSSTHFTPRRRRRPMNGNGEQQQQLFTVLSRLQDRTAFTFIWWWFYPLTLSPCPFAHVQLIISPNRNRDQGIETCGWGWGRGCHGTFSDTWKLW